MGYASSEKDFYTRHYQGGIKIDPRADFAATEAFHFAPGKRYHLMLSELDASQRLGTLVEIGCADGHSVLYLANRFRFDKVIGIDIAFPDDMDSEIGGVKFLQANSNEPLPLADGSVDVFVAMMVIEHLFDPFHAFTDIKRLLAPTGRAFVNLPLVTSWRNRLRLLTGKLPETSVSFDRWLADREWDGNHLHYFSVESIRQLLDRCGLKMTKMSCAGSNHKLKEMAPSILASELSFVVTHA
jgi:SAM-dependent methyltransferase